MNQAPKFDRQGVPDLYGMRIRGTSAYRTFLRALKASTVNVRSSRLGAALSQGRIQGVALPNALGNPSRISANLKFAISPSFYRINTVVIADSRRFNTLNAEQQECIGDAARAYERESHEFIAGKIADHMQAFSADGGQVIQLPPDAANRYLAIAYRAKWSDFLRRVADGSELRSKLFAPIPVAQSAMKPGR